MARKKKQETSQILPHTLIKGDALDALDQVSARSCRLVITSPPYNVGKSYERDCKRTLDEYLEWLEPIIVKSCEKVSEDGHLCWQIGNYINNGEVFPLDYYIYSIISKAGFKLRNRIIWHFNFGLHATKRFSGRYETLLWFTRSEDYFFQLEPVLIPQLYPGKRHSSKKGEKAGKPSGNPKGKNPSDFWSFSPKDTFINNPIWEVPNVKANHPEKTIHPCQFPSELVERCVLSMTQEGDKILDPFVGSGTTIVAAEKHQRIGIGIDKSQEYIKLAEQRLIDQRSGKVVTRQFGRAVYQPKESESVSQIPEEWVVAAE